jgi:hypothetical protein
MWWSVPVIFPYALAFALARWYFGNPWPGVAVHYTVNSLYFIALLDT